MGSTTRIASSSYGKFQNGFLQVMFDAQQGSDIEYVFT
jgi:hypothetical protein